MKNVFFGVMVGDLFLGEEHLPDDVEIDYDASRDKYIEMCTAAIIREYAALGETVEVDSDWQNVGGSVPAGLKTRVWEDGDYYDDDSGEIEFVDGIIGQVWETWKWLMVKKPVAAEVKKWYASLSPAEKLRHNLSKEVIIL